MALIKPDLSEVTDLAPIKPGAYAARIIECEQRVGKTSGNPYLNWKLSLFGKPEVNNRTLFYTTPLSGGGAFRLRDLFEAAMGEKLDKKSPEFDTDMLVGKEVTITVIEARDQEGNVRPNPEVKTVSKYA